MIRYKHIQQGPLFAAHYEFEKAGDHIKMHTHAPDMAHNVCVVKGRVHITCGGFGDVFGPGQVANIEWDKPHEVEALEDDTETIHYYLNGKPKSYEGLPESEFQGTM
jgi:quercetin dioxygenase-like cupin family protein